MLKLGSQNISAVYVGGTKIKRALVGEAVVFEGLQTVSVPTRSGTLTYNASAQSPTWGGYDSSVMTIGGTTSATEAGTYTATFTPKSGYQWSDGTTETKSVSWTIAVLDFVVPFASNINVNYTGGVVACPYTWDSKYISASGSTSATNVGNYSVTFSLKNKSSTRFRVGLGSVYEYTTDDQTLLWSIVAVAQTPTFSISPNSSSRSVATGDSISWTVTTNSDGEIYATVSDSGGLIGGGEIMTADRAGAGGGSAVSPNISIKPTAIATVSVLGNTVTARGVSVGKGTIEIGVKATSAYKAARKTVSLEVVKSNGNVTV